MQVEGRYSGALSDVVAYSTDLTVVSVSYCFFFFSSRRRHTRLQGDWSSDVCSSDLDLAVLQRSRLIQRLALDPLGHQRRRGNRGTAAVGLETRILDDTGFGIDLDLQLHHVAAGRSADHAGAHRFVVLVERAHVAGIFVVVYHFVGISHDVYLFNT